MAAEPEIEQVALERRGAPALGLAVEAREPMLPEADEVFRGIYTRAGASLASEVLAVTSAISGEGKTTISLGLATTIAQDYPERRVLLIETDVQRPVLAADFDLEPTPGLVEYLLERAPFEEACRVSSLENLHLLPAGGAVSGAGRVLRSARMASAIDALREAYELVIVDAPAMLVNSDALLLTDLADLVVFVVRAGVTPQPLVNRALEQLDQTKLRGVVLNDARPATPGWLRRICGL